MLTDAAIGGHEATCRLAKEWGANDFVGMREGAARGGNGALGRLAQEWIDEQAQS
jgi:hypothetical protein